jgi:hypothetical protein
MKPRGVNRGIAENPGGGALRKGPVAAVSRRISRLPYWGEYSAADRPVL